MRMMLVGCALYWIISLYLRVWLPMLHALYDCLHEGDNPSDHCPVLMHHNVSVEHLPTDRSSIHRSGLPWKTVPDDIALLAPSLHALAHAQSLPFAEAIQTSLGVCTLSALSTELTCTCFVVLHLFHRFIVSTALSISLALLHCTILFICETAVTHRLSAANSMILSMICV